MSSVSVEYPSGKVGDVTPPIVNLNGSAGATLRDAYDAAVSAGSDALLALYDTAPNGRDYQTAPPGAFETARREHDRRIAALRDVQAELVALRDAVQDQIDARESRRMTYRLGAPDAKGRLNTIEARLWRGELCDTTECWETKARRDQEAARKARRKKDKP